MESSGAVSIGEVKTGNSRDALILTDDVCAVLRAHQQRQQDDRKRAADAWTETGLVFTTSLGTPMNPRNVLRTFKRLIDALPVAAIRLHDLRHTHASLALQRGIPVEVVTERLGHARVHITLSTSRHDYQAERRAAAISLNDLLGRTPSTVN